MPFTLSHPAAVLPLLRRPFVPAALIAGAVAPDVPYFLKVPITAESWYEPFVNATFSHSLQGLVLVGLPTVMLLAAIAQFMRAPLGDLVPFRIQSKTRRENPPRGWFIYTVWFAVSALIGLVSHFAWDALTHGGGWLTTVMPFLNENLIMGISGDRVLQHASTLLGAIVIVIWCLWRYRSQQMSIEKLPVSRSWQVKRIAFVALLLLASATFAVLSLLEAMRHDDLIGTELAMSKLFTDATSFALVGVGIYVIAWHVSAFLKSRTRIQPV